jgi:4-oxalocrotonate tautomerase
MPFINIKMLKGRTIDQKRELVKTITNAMVDICHAKADGTIIIIEEVEHEDWAKGGILVADRPK